VSNKALVLIVALLISATAHGQVRQPTPEDPLNSFKTVAELVAAATAAATSVSTIVAKLPESMSEAISSPDVALRTYQAMQDAVAKALEGLDERAPLWLKAQELMDFTAHRSDLARQRLEAGDMRFKVNLQLWDAQRTRAAKVRADIIRERERAKGLKLQIDRDRDYTIDLIVLGRVMEALSDFERANGQLKAMNVAMEEIRQQTEQLNKPQLSN
jgi:hypothetical protein